MNFGFSILDFGLNCRNHESTRIGTNQGVRIREDSCRFVVHFPVKNGRAIKFNGMDIVNSTVDHSCDVTNFVHPIIT